jgi:DNA-binding transcriptional MerR regulator
LWTLDELCAQVAEALAAGSAALPDGRVREVPDRRTIRYYTTLGLIDRPAEMCGRTAYYGRKHLLQLVAIKRLQGRGLALAEIQQRLLGLSEAELRPLAQLPDEPGPTAASESRSRGAETAFWRTAPAPVAPPVSPEDQPETAAVRLAAGAILLLEAARALRPEDAAAIRKAAAPLLDLLATRGLLPAAGAADKEDQRSPSEKEPA